MRAAAATCRLFPVVLAGACASGGSNPAWMELSEVERPERDAQQTYDVVKLLRERDIEFKLLKRGGKTIKRHHYAVAILTEDGRDQYGDLKVRVLKKADLLGFEARNILPDGTVVPIEPKNIKVDESDDDDGIEVHTIFMPKVEVGSVLEWHFTTVYPFVFSAHEEYLDDRNVPVLRSKFTIRGDKGVRYTIRPYNLPPGVELQQATEGGQWIISAELEDLQPIEDDERHLPTRERIDPWIAYSTRQIVKGTEIYDLSRTWDGALKWRAAELYWNSDDWYAGADMDVDVSACADALCKIQKDLQWLRDELAIRGVGSLPGRKAKTSIEVGSATAHEKTRIMHRLLEDQGIESFFALGRPFHDGPVDREVPTWLGFRYMLLRVPKQDGIAQAMWLDPGCEYCEAGQVSRPVNRTRFAVIRPASVAVGGKQGKAEVEFTKVEAPRPKRGWAYKKVEVGLSEDGSARLSELHIGTNDVAQSRRDDRRLRESKDWEDEWKEYVSDIDGNARLTDWSAETYHSDGDRSTTRVSLEMPSYAVPTDEELIVPLRLVQSDWDERFEDGSRTNEILFRRSHRYRDQFVFRFPEGWTIDALPDNESFGSSPLVAKIEWSEVEGGVELTRTLKTRRGRYDVDVYEQLRETLRSFRGVKKGSLRLVRVK